MIAATSSGVSVCARPPRDVCENTRTDDSCRTDTPMPASVASITLVRARSRQDGSAGRVVVIGMRCELYRTASPGLIGIDRQDLDFTGSPANLPLAEGRCCDGRLQPIVGRAAHENLIRFGERLEPGRRVDDVAEDRVLAPARRADVAGDRHAAVDRVADAQPAAAGGAQPRPGAPQRL